MDGTHRNHAIDSSLVRLKAYEIWQSLGSPEGVAEQTWLEAEKQLLTRSTKSTTEEASRSRPAVEARPAAAAAPLSEPPESRSKIISEPPTTATHAAKLKKPASNSRRTSRH